MPITDILEKNCRLYGDEVCLVEINPEMPETRREITLNVFNAKSNRFANLLLER